MEDTKAQVIIVLGGEYNGTSTEYSEAHSRGIEPSLWGAIREGFLQEVRWKFIPKERRGVC